MAKKTGKTGFKKNNLVNELEKERTMMADDRTLLSFVRTSLSIFIFGIFLIKFFPEVPNIFLIFVLTIVFGIVVMVVGTVEYLIFRKEINR